MEQVKIKKLKHWSVGAVFGVYVPIIVFALLCLLPFIMVVATSFSESDLVKEFGCSFLPRGWSVDAYKTIFIYPDQILNAYLNSLIVTVIGSILNVILAISVAYPISKLDFRFRSVITFIMFLTTAFSAGLVPLKKAGVGLVTQNFHVYRSVQLARRQQYERVSGIAAPSEPVNFPHFMVREAFALVKEKLVGNL